MFEPGPRFSNRAFILVIRWLPLISFFVFSALLTAQADSLKNTRVGSWQLREILTVQGQKIKNIAISKIACVWKYRDKDHPGVWIEVEHQNYEVNGLGKRKKKGPPLIYKMLVEQDYFEREFLTLESDPISGARRIFMKTGEEDPVFITRGNFKTFTKITGPFLHYQYHFQVNEIVLVPKGPFDCFKYSGRSVSSPSNSAQKAQLGATSTIWVHAKIPFGVVKRVSEYQHDGEQIYIEVQLLDYDVRGAFPNIVKVVKKSPFRSLSYLLQGLNGD